MSYPQPGLTYRWCNSERLTGTLGCVLRKRDDKFNWS